jgi:uncharacterized protein
MWRCIAIVLFLISVRSADAGETKPSFDCRAAQSAAETMICSDDQLASFDQEMSGAFRDAQSAGKIDKASQIDWLRRRDADCAGGDLRECLSRHIRLRIAALHSATGSGPSFNCDKAHSALEFSICTDPALAQLDLVLANAFRYALGARKVDQRSQAEWLRRRDAECHAPDQALTRQQRQPDWQRKDDLLRCLSNHMQQRLSELQSAYGFAFGTAACSPNGTVSVVFEIPPVPEEYLVAEYGSIFPDRLFTWRCDPNPRTSVTVKYGFEPNRPCGTLSIWENGIKVAQQLSIAQCEQEGVLRSVTITAAGMAVCYSMDVPRPRQRCDRTPRTAFPGDKDPYFAPGRAPEEPEPSLVQMPMQPLDGKDNPSCKVFADRLAANWQDDFADIEAKIAWRNVDFPADRFASEIAIAQFDIDNDGQPETVLRENYHSHATEGERYTVFPADSWVRDLRVVDKEQEFYAALRAARTAADTSPAKAFGLPNPFPSAWTDHYSLKVLTVDGRTIMFANPVDYWKASWEDSVRPGEPARIFFEVLKDRKIKTVCSFAPPYRLGAQL